MPNVCVKKRNYFYRFSPRSYQAYLFAIRATPEGLRGKGGSPLRRDRRPHCRAWGHESDYAGAKQRILRRALKGCEGIGADLTQ